MPLVGVRTVDELPLVIAALGEDGAVGQREVLVFGGEAQGLAPAAVAGGAGAAHHHVKPVGGVGQQAADGGAAGGLGGHDGLVLLVAVLPVAEGVGAGGADGRVGQGVEGGRGGGHIGGGEHGGLAAGGHGGELAHRPVAVLIHAAHGAYVEVVVHVGRQTCGQVLGGRGGDGSGLKGAGLGLTGAEHILPAGLRVAGHPADGGAVGGHVADGDVGHIHAGALLVAELHFRQEALARAAAREVVVAAAGAIAAGVGSADTIEVYIAITASIVRVGLQCYEQVAAGVGEAVGEDNVEAVGGIHLTTHHNAVVDRSGIVDIEEAAESGVLHHLHLHCHRLGVSPGVTIARIDEVVQAGDGLAHKASEHLGGIYGLVSHGTIHIVTIDGQVSVVHRAVGHKFAGGGHRRGRHLVEVGGAAVGLGRSLVGAHIEVVARLRRQAHGGVVHGADGGPAGRGLAMGHHGDLPLRLVGKLRRVALPCVGYGGVRHLRGGDVHHGGQGVVCGEALAHPGRGTLAAAVVLHIEVVGGGGAEACQAGSGLGEARAGLGHGVQRGIGQAAGGAQYVVEVVGLCGLGLLPGGRGRALAGLHHADVGHRAALAHGAEAVAEPLAAAVVVAAGLAVGAHVHVVHCVGRQARGVVGGGGALIGVGAVVGRQGGGVKLGAGHQHLVAAQVVGRGHGLPGQRGLRLGDVRGLHGGHRRAGFVGLAIGG